MKIHRRKLLKSSCTGLATVYTPLGLADQAGATNRSDEFAGMSYHTATHKIQDTVEATLRRDAKRRLSGTIKVAGFNIPFNNERPKITPDGRAVYKGKSTKPEHVKNKNSLTYKLVDHGNQICGHISRDTVKKGKVGITIKETNSNHPVKAVQNALQNSAVGDRRGTIESTGIPDAILPEDTK